MKMLMIVGMIRFIIALIENKNKENDKVNDVMNMQHPAEFRTR